MTYSKDIEIAEMAVCTAVCVMPDIKTALVSPKFLDVFKALEPNLALNTKPFDVVILDDMPINVCDIKAQMSSKGVLVCKIGDGDIKGTKEALKKLGENFRIVMPFLNLSLAFASDYYHPTADIILQKADLLDDLIVYNADFHKASFILPNWQIKEILGISKN